MTDTAQHKILIYPRGDLPETKIEEIQNMGFVVIESDIREGYSVINQQIDLSSTGLVNDLISMILAHDSSVLSQKAMRVIARHMKAQ